MKKLDFVSASEMHELHPETFQIPSKAELSQVKVGSIVKVSVGGERFWNEVIDVTGDILTAKVDNDLVCTDEHGLNCGDVIEFTLDNVISIYDE